MKKIEELGASPAPWELMDDGTTVVCPTDRDDDAYGEVAVCQGGKADSANARLIAAAPLLYEALREAAIERCHWCGYYSMEDGLKCSRYDGECSVQKCRAALAKAGGAE